MLTGHFKLFIIFTSIILIHELGHLLMGTFFKWKIDKIILLPFGGITIFNDNLNKPLTEEFIIAIMGPIFQIIYLLLIKDNSFRNLNISILLFNILPILPLDGSKIINIIMNKFISFRSSYLLSIYISMISWIIIIIYFKFDFLVSLIFIFLLIEIFKNYTKLEYYYNRFLLERYLNNFSFKRLITIDNIKKFCKGKRHLIKKNKKIYTERQILSKMFDK